MFENLGHFFKRMVKTEQQKELGSKDAAKERLHLVLMQDRANVSADFLELMKQEIIDVIKKYIVVDEDAIDVRLTNQSNDDGTNGAPALYANIPIVNIKNDMMAEKIKEFEGVDFNKEIGIPGYEQKENEEENKEETPQVIELSEKYEETTITDKVSSENNNKDSKEEQDEEVKEMFEEVDEDDDDDVTFDDLLKAAEEADAAEIDNKTENSKENSKKNSNTKDKRKKK
jgi:cell division topological specificity factor